MNIPRWIVRRKADHAKYEKARDALVSDAADAIDVFGEDELERYANERRCAEARIVIDPHPYDRGCGVADTEDEGDYLDHCRTRKDAEELRRKILDNWEEYESVRLDSRRLFEFIEELDANGEMK